MTTSDQNISWLKTDGYELALVDGAIVCRNSKGRQLKSVPAKAKKTAEFEQLAARREFIGQHEHSCKTQVSDWFLKGEPIPAALVVKVWADPAWRMWLTDVVVECGSTVGLLRDTDGDHLRIVDLDGETIALPVGGSDVVRIPHPVVMDDIADWREFAVELGVHQNLDQLLRDIYPKPADEKGLRRAVKAYDGVKYGQSPHLLGRARGGGFKTDLQSVRVVVVDNGQSTTATLNIDAWDSDGEATLGTVEFSRAGRNLTLKEVGPVAWSEGIRMAEYIYAGRSAETAS